MDGSNRQMIRLLLFILCYSSTALMYRPLVPLYLESLGTPPLGVGVIVAAYSMVPALLSLGAANVIASHSIRNLLGAGSIMIMIGCVTLAVFTSSPVLFAGQLISGTSAILVVVGAQSYVQQVSDPAHLSRNFALLVGVFSVADVTGPLLGGTLVRAVGYQNAFAATAVFAMMGLVISRTFGARRLEGTGPERVTLAAIRAVASSPQYRMGLALTVAGISIMSLSMSFYPVYLARVGLAPGVVGLVLSVRGVGQLMAPVMIGAMERKLGRTWVVGSALAGGAVAALLVPALTSLPSLMAASLVLGCAFGLLIPMSLVMVSEGGAAGGRVLGLSLRFTFNRVTDTLGPIAFGAGTHWWGISAPFQMATAYLALTLALVLGHRRVLEREPVTRSATGAP